MRLGVAVACGIGFQIVLGGLGPMEEHTKGRQPFGCLPVYCLGTRSLAADIQKIGVPDDLLQACRVAVTQNLIDLTVDLYQLLLQPPTCRGTCIPLELPALE